VAGPAGVSPAGYLSAASPHVTDEPLRGAIEAAVACAAESREPEQLAAALGLRGGVSGWINHTVPAALYCWLRWPGDFRTAVAQVVLMGGDADTTGAIVGALVSATAGVGAIPQDWLDGIAEWPRSVRWMRLLSQRLAGSADPSTGGPPPRPLPVFWPGVIPRNVLFLGIVLLHGVRRLLPPY
jgi:hypothetical protein